MSLVFFILHFYSCQIYFSGHLISEEIENVKNENDDSNCLLLIASSDPFPHAVVSGINNKKYI